MKGAIQRQKSPKTRQPPPSFNFNPPPPPPPLSQPTVSWATVAQAPPPRNPAATGNDQLSPEECMKVFDHFTTLYEQGLTIQQQIRAIAEFTFTFMYNRARQNDRR